MERAKHLHVLGHTLTAAAQRHDVIGREVKVGTASDRTPRLFAQRSRAELLPGRIVATLLARAAAPFVGLLAGSAACAFRQPVTLNARAERHRRGFTQHARL